MDQSIAVVVNIYKFNTGSFLRALEGIEQSDHFVRPSDKANSLNYVAGHMTASRYLLAGSLKLDEPQPWADLFSRGAKIEENSAYPELSEITEHWHQISSKLEKRFEVVTAEDLKAEPPFTVPGIEKTVRGTIAFLSFHESYHLGQLAYIRRLLGYDQLHG